MGVSAVWMSYRTDADDAVPHDRDADIGKGTLWSERKGC